MQMGNKYVTFLYNLAYDSHRFVSEELFLSATASEAASPKLTATSNSRPPLSILKCKFHMNIGN